MPHGGKRPGAGRKPAPEGTQKVPYATKLAPTVVKYLRSRENAAQTIETLVAKSKEFKKWEKKRSMKYISVICWTKGKKHGWLVDLCDSESSETIQSFGHESEARAFAEKYAEENGLEIKVP